MATNKNKTENQELTPLKTCFIITPIGDENSEIRKKADGLIEAIIKPVMNNLNYELIVPHEMMRPGSITTQVIDSILNAEMVIANLSGLNPNVMYELAVRHAVRKPIVCLVEKTTKLPFDISQDRVIFYNDEFYSVESLKTDLSDMVESAIGQVSNEIDNPIYRAKTSKYVIDALSKGNDGKDIDVIKTLLERFNRLEDLIGYNSRQSFVSPVDSWSFSISSDRFEELDISDVSSVIARKLRVVQKVSASVILINSKTIRVVIYDNGVAKSRIINYVSLLLEKNYGVTDTLVALNNQLSA